MFQFSSTLQLQEKFPVRCKSTVLLLFVEVFLKVFDKFYANYNFHILKWHLNFILFFIRHNIITWETAEGKENVYYHPDLLVSKSEHHFVINLKSPPTKT